VLGGTLSGMMRDPASETGQIVCCESHRTASKFVNGSSHTARSIADDTATGVTGGDGSGMEGSKPTPITRPWPCDAGSAGGSPAVIGRPGR